MFKRVLVANRGEIALRIIHAAKNLGIETVAVYSTADKDAAHVDAADFAHCIGEGRSAASYLNEDAILQAALQYECQALHPGYGFLAERARFAARCEAQKTTFIGPRPETIRAMGDKIQARRLMNALGVPTLPGTKGAIASLTEAVEAAAEIGYPVLLKASAGGGGKGMSRCDDEGALRERWPIVKLEAGNAFGDDTIYIERFIEDGRHIEFQVLADRFGKVIHLGERECSVQRNNQKLIEETPSPCIDESTRSEIGGRVVKALASIGYLGAGTVEFLRDNQGQLHFLEMNTRLQVEHPVSELVTGLDIVDWQFRLAAGERLTIEQAEVELKGAAIEVRINAEDPAKQFQASPGSVEAIRFPEQWRYQLAGPMRFDSHIFDGKRIPPYYDSMIGKLIAHGASRDEARTRLIGALRELEINGIATTVAMQERLLEAPAFVQGNYTTAQMAAFIGELFETGSAEASE